LFYRLHFLWAASPVCGLEARGPGSPSRAWVTELKLAGTLGPQASSLHSGLELPYHQTAYKVKIDSL